MSAMFFRSFAAAQRTMGGVSFADGPDAVVAPSAGDRLADAGQLDRKVVKPRKSPQRAPTSRRSHPRRGSAGEER